MYNCNARSAMSQKNRGRGLQYAYLYVRDAIGMAYCAVRRLAQFRESCRRDDFSRAMAEKTGLLPVG